LSPELNIPLSISIYLSYLYIWVRRDLIQTVKLNFQGALTQPTILPKSGLLSTYHLNHPTSLIPHPHV
jgi:hypothetical protein